MLLQVSATKDVLFKEKLGSTNNTPKESCKHVSNVDTKFREKIRQLLWKLVKLQTLSQKHTTA